MGLKEGLKIDEKMEKKVFVLYKTIVLGLFILTATVLGILGKYKEANLCIDFGLLVFLIWNGIWLISAVEHIPFKRFLLGLIILIGIAGVIFLYCLYSGITVKVAR